jgi:hypothetical protein
MNTVINRLKQKNDRNETIFARSETKEIVEPAQSNGNGSGDDQDGAGFFGKIQ